MPAQLPPELYDQVTSFDIDPQRMARLASIYYRSIARRLWSQLPDVAGEPPAIGGGGRMRWLHPRSVFAAQAIGVSREPSEFAGQAASFGELLAVQSATPKVEHLTSSCTETWCADALDQIAAARAEVGADQPIRLASELAPERQRRFDDALGVLDRCWPEAALEFCLLIRCMVYVAGLEFGSATLPETFGAIYADLAELTSVTSAFEMILHETAHHSLYLRNIFENFVLNGSDVVSHPLRADPRHISGTLHAAQVLARITVGLTRWCADPGAPAEARADLADMAGKLAVTLDVLSAHAQWTPAGSRFFAELQACRSDPAPREAADAGRPETSGR